jgi:hypothetical protein
MLTRGNSAHTAGASERFRVKTAARRGRFVLTRQFVETRAVCAYHLRATPDPVMRET